MRHFLVLLAMFMWTAELAAQQPSTNAPHAPRQVWDYSEKLGLTASQRDSLIAAKAEYEKAQAELRRSSDTNTPPDVRLAAQLAFNDHLRLINRTIDELLTPEQKKKLASLRAPHRQVDPAAAADSDADDPEPAPRDSSPARRRLLSDDELRRLAADLRQLYARPPRDWPAPELDDTPKPHFRELGLLPPIPFPPDNPYTPAKAELGKRLFFDPRLSGSGQISCASCHDPDLAFADGRTVSFGHSRKALKRSSPGLVNIGQGHSFFWDGRASTLEQQATDVVHNEDEMQSNAKIIRERLSAIPGYTNEFARVFGTAEISMTRVAQAIATFERTLASRGNAFDSFLRGDTNSLSDAAIRGLHLFRTTARCVNCHHGPNFTDERFHNEGLSYYGRKLQDLGRYDVTGAPADVGAFKTPSLRNVSRTAPYMHNGLFDLQGVLNMYNAGMPTLRPNARQKEDPLFPSKSPHLKPLGLNGRDLEDLKAFLESLTETRLRMRPPEMH